MSNGRRDRAFFLLGIFFLLLLGSSMVSAQGAKLTPNEVTGQRERSEADRVRAREQWFRHGRSVKGESAAALRYRALLQKRRLAEKRRAASQPGTVSQQPSTSLSGAVVPATTTSPGSAVWTNLGPAPINSDWLDGTVNDGFQDYGSVSGRVAAVAVDQSDTTGNTVYVGGAYGGVWKSTNAANATAANVTWTQLLDDQASLAVGAIAVSPDGQTILVGTGEPNNSGDSYYGVGILRSTNAGATWTLLQSADSGTHPFKGLGFTKIAFNTADPTKVVAATAAPNITGGLAGWIRGLYYSTDGGATWHLSSVLDGATPISAASTSDVVYNPSANAFFATVRFHGIYKSTNNGATFSRLSTQPTGLTAAACPVSVNLNNPCPIYRGELAVRPGANEMYVWFVDASETNKGIFKTINGGSTWTTLSVAGINTCGDGTTADGCGTSQGTYNLYIAAVPNGSGTDLYAGAVNLFKCSIPAGQTGTLCGAAANGSTSGTNRWMNLTHVYGCDSTGIIGKLAHVHPDQHAVDFSQSSPNIVYFGNDGGIYRTLTSSTGLATGLCTGTNAFQNLNGTIGSMSQFVSMSQHSTDDGILLGGLQDNGSPAIDRTSNPDTTFWQAVNGGDGGFNQIDPSNPNIWYVTNFDVSIQRCTQGTNCRGSSFPVVIDNTGVGGDGGAFYTPFILDPQMPARILVGTCRIWRGNGDGTGMASLSNKLNDGGTGVCGSVFDSTAESAYVRSLAAGGPTTGNGSQVLYAGLTDGRIWVTTNADSGAASWADRTAGTSNPGFDISDIFVDPSDATGRTAYITIMGFGTPHLYRTTNAGVNWTDVSGDLPDAPADSVVVDPANPKVVYIGTDIGVFVTTDVTAGAVQWDLYGVDSGAGALPNVPVTRLLTYTTGGARKLRASTYGRGVWETDLLAAADFALAVTDPDQTAYAGATAAFHGTLTATGSYNSPVNLSCDAGGGAAPATCAAAVTPVTPTDAGAAFTINASDTTAADYSFAVKGVGTDAATTTHQQSVTLRVIDFQLADGADFSLAAGDSGQTTLALSRSANFPAGRSITGACNITSPPTGMSCSVTPSTRTSDGDFTLAIQTTRATPAGIYDVVVTAADGVVPAEQRTQTVQVTVTPAPPATLTVVSPNGGESWSLGSSHAISWTHTGLNSSATVKVQLLKNGATWSTLSASTPAGASGSGSFLWTISQSLPTASDYRIRVVTTDGTVVDTSDATFSLTPVVDQITVLSPNGGESWNTGTAQTIQWSYSGAVGTTARIELLKSGVVWSVLNASVAMGSGGLGSFSWTPSVSLATASDYRIRVTSNSNTAIKDVSDANFSLSPPASSITVTSPNGGESWALGSTHNITWNFTGLSGTVKVQLLRNGVVWSNLATSAPIGSAGAGSFSWTISAALATAPDYRVRVISNSNTAINDTSDAAFSLAPPASSITVTSPNGAESWVLGSTHAITWNYTGVTGTVTVQLLKNGVLWSNLSTGASIGSAGSGSFNWTIPAGLAAASDYRIRVTSNSNTAIKDVSDANFSLTP